MTERNANIVPEPGEGPFFRVARNMDRAPLRDHLWWGYEEKSDFRLALRGLLDRWRCRVGECVGERHGLRLLRFHDTPGGRPDEAWLPEFLLEPAPRPDYFDVPAPDPARRELEEAFGFD